MKYKIRKARRSDFKNIVEVNYNSNHPLNIKFNATRKELCQWFMPKFLDKESETYVYEENNIGAERNCRAHTKIIGVIVLKKYFSVHNSCEITVLAVDKNFQRKGIGGKLVKFIEKRTKKLGFKRLFLYTSLKNNRKARRFYEKIGYKKINIFPGYYSWGGDAVLYGKKLK